MVGEFEAEQAARLQRGSAMSERDEISLRAAAKGVTIWCAYCLGAVRNQQEGQTRCACEQPKTSEASATLDAMLAASRRGRTVR